MSNIETVVCAQVNMHEGVIPLYILSVNEIKTLLSLLSYTLIHKSVNYYSIHNFDNIQMPYSDSKFMNLIFKREII